MKCKTLTAVNCVTVVLKLRKKKIEVRCGKMSHVRQRLIACEVSQFEPRCTSSFVCCMQEPPRAGRLRDRSLRQQSRKVGLVECLQSAFVVCGLRSFFHPHHGKLRSWIPSSTTIKLSTAPRTASRTPEVGWSTSQNTIDTLLPC